MEKKDLKKSWVVPELIVLVRNKPAEVVLTNCKLSGLSTGPGNIDSGCDTTGCVICNAIDFS